MKSVLAVLALAAALAVAPVAAQAGDTNDAWITTKAKISLLTSEGFSVSGANVDTVNGNVTIHGKVATEADKTAAEATVTKVKGVKTVKNLLQVVPKDVKKAVAKTDAEIKDKVEASLKGVPIVKDVKVASVNKGVVLLSGKTESLADKLNAVEIVYKVEGVDRVATEIEVVAGDED